MQDDKHKLMDLFFSEEWDAIIPAHLSCVAPFLSEKTFHIFAEYAYANAFIQHDKNIDFWRKIYIDIQKYYHLDNSIEMFDSLICSIQKYGFNPNYPIPIDTDYHIIDGSHRLSISMALGITPYIYMCKKKSTLFPKENFSVLDAIQMKALNNIHKEVMQKFSITTEDKNIFYLSGKELDFWNECMKIKTIRENSCFFILRLPYAEYEKVVIKNKANGKFEHLSLGIIITNLTRYKMKKTLPSTYPLPHISAYLTENLKKYCKFT